MLYQHQKIIINENKPKAGLFLGCGSGKTRIALLLKQGSVMVICPKTQREDRNWERECDKLGLPHPTVISKERFRRDHQTLPAVQTLIVDEAETCLGVTPNTRQKNKVVFPKASQLFDALQWYVTNRKPSRIYLCTATITRTPMTVWGAGRILGKKWDWYSWRDFFYQRLPMPGREVYVPKTGEAQKNRLAKAVNSIGYVGRLEDYFDVPDQTYKDDYVDLTKEQLNAINDIKIDYPDPIVAIGKRLQIENGVLKGDEFTAAKTFTNNKLQRVLHYAEEFPRLIIWCKYTAQIKLYEQALQHYNVFTLTGQTTDRSTLFARLAGESNAILIAQAQISAGWEWKECPAVIFASRTYSISDYEQALGRVQRTDAIKKNIYINLIARGGIDEALDHTLKNKQDFSERIYAEKNNSI